MKMHLYIATMDSLLVEFSPDGRVRLADRESLRSSGRSSRAGVGSPRATENDDWSTPTLQERRAIVHAAEQEIARLQDLIEAVSPASGKS